MVSGRYRSETLCRYWSDNKGGFCRAPTCYQTPGTIEHLLTNCPALDIVRERMYTMWLEKSVMYPALHATIRNVLESDYETTKGDTSCTDHEDHEYHVVTSSLISLPNHEHHEESHGAHENLVLYLL